MPLPFLAMAGIGAATGLAGSLLGKKPKIPTFTPVDQTEEQQAAISANLASFGDAKKLADMTATADQDRLESILMRTMPNYKEMLAGSGEAISNMIAGNLPMADQNLIQRKAAERSGGLGLAGSAAGRNLTARDLGLTQYSMTQTGLNAFNALSSNIRQNYTVNPMSTASSYVSPSQWINNAINQNQFAYTAAVGKAQSDAANSMQSRIGGQLGVMGGTMFGAGIQGELFSRVFGPTGAGNKQQS